MSTAEKLPQEHNWQRFSLKQSYFISFGLKSRVFIPFLHYQIFDLTVSKSSHFLTLLNLMFL
ncbi:MAG: hypothetical protein CBC00_05095 [Verrucomicrobia bacterium TMED40]|nr:MAG: hypothetical protein CBC00_05095 [Verrucomicrobia bacterium TMED40]